MGINQGIGILLLLSHFSRVRLCVTPQTAAHQAPPSLGFSRQEYWSGVLLPSPNRDTRGSYWRLVMTFSDTDINLVFRKDGNNIFRK